jgi:hypothetical protein
MERVFSKLLPGWFLFPKQFWLNAFLLPVDSQPTLHLSPMSFSFKKAMSL